MREVKVLVLDDEEIICRNICSKLSRLDHGVKYVSYSAGNIQKGMQLYQEINPQVIMTDICMPNGSGLLFIERIRAVDKEVTIFVLSGFDDFTYVRKAFLLGVNDYLLKPLSITELDEKLSHHMYGLKKESKASKVQDVIELAKEYVENNLERKISLKEISDVTNMSYTYFCRLFKEKEKISFSQYVNQRQMKIAKELLEDSRNKVSDISKKLGYLYPHHFSRSFYKTFGIYPTEYRMQQLGKTEDFCLTEDDEEKEGEDRHE